MSGTKINNYDQTDSNILEVQLTLDATRIGYHQVSLTNYDSTSESQIAAGSIIEVGGALYKFTSNESITGSPSDGTVYIMIVPGTTTCTAQYTNTAPTWSDSKQGWYGTGTSANHRYLEFIIYKSGTTWSNKYSYFKNQEKTFNYLLSYYATSKTIIANSETALLYDTKIYDKWTDYNVATGVLTIKIAGYYEIYASLLIAPYVTNAIRSFSNGLRIYKNTSTEIGNLFQGNVRPATTSSGTRNILTNGLLNFYLDVDDTITIKYYYGVIDASNATVSENGSIPNNYQGSSLIVKYCGDL